MNLVTKLANMAQYCTLSIGDEVRLKKWPDTRYRIISEPYPFGRKDTPYVKLLDLMSPGRECQNPISCLEPIP